MAIIGHRIPAFALAGALSLGLRRTGAAQPADTAFVRLANAPAGAPAARRESKSKARQGEAWIPGYWDLQGDQFTSPRGGWVWVPGRWEPPPAKGAHWVDGEFGWYNDWWTWIPGHWDK